METTPNSIDLVLLLKSGATPLSLAKNKIECLNSGPSQEWKKSLLKREKKMVEAKLLGRQVIYWKESIGGLVLISPENQRGRVDLLTYN